MKRLVLAVGLGIIVAMAAAVVFVPRGESPGSDGSNNSIPVVREISVDEGANVGAESGATAAAPDRPLPLGVERSVSYELGEERLESPHTHVHHALGTTDEAAREGDRAGFAHLLPGDPEFANGNRAEWHSALFSDPGDVMSYAVSYWFPADWNAYGSTDDTFDFSIIFQIHGGGPSPWSPLYGIKLFERDSQHLVGFYQKESPRGPDTILWSQPVVVEEWVDFAVEVLWSDEPDGYIRFFRNGDLAYEEVDVATLPGDADLYAKWGIYGQPARIIFDEVRITRGALEWG